MAKNKIAYAASAAALALSGVVIPTNVLADAAECNAQSSGECTASTADILRAGLSNTNVSTISLTGDITGVNDGPISVNREVELNLNKYKISNETLTYNLFEVEQDGDLTITGEGSVEAGRNAFYVDGGTLTIENGDFMAHGTSANNYATGVVVMPVHGGTVYVNDGTLRTEAREPIGGNNDDGDMNVYISGGTLTSGQNTPVIYMPSQGVLEISGGTLNGGVVARMGQISISGGTIYSATNIDDPMLNANFVWMPGVVNIMGGSYDSKSDNTHENSVTLNIEGGTFISNNTSEYGGTVAIWDYEKKAQDIDVTISGGTFTVKEENNQKPVMLYNHESEDRIAAGVQNDVSIAVAGGTYNVVPGHVNTDTHTTYAVTNDGATNYRVAAKSEFGAEATGAVLQPGDRYDLTEIIRTSAPADYDGGWTYTVTQNDVVSQTGGTTVRVDDTVIEDTEVTVVVTATGANLSYEVKLVVAGGMTRLNEIDEDNSVTIDFAEAIEGDDIRLEVEVVDIPEEVEAAEPDMKLVYDITLMDGDEIVDVTNNDMSITLKVSPEKIGGYYDYFQIAYIENGKIVKYIDPTYADLGGMDGLYYITFKTDHLSEYGLIASNTRIASAADKNDALNAPDSGAYTAEAAGNIDTTALVATVIVMTLAAGAMEVVAYKKRQARK